MSKGAAEAMPQVPFFRRPTLRLKAPTIVVALGLTLAMTTGCSGIGTTSSSADGAEETATEVATDIVTEVETAAPTEVGGDIPQRIISLSPAATGVIDAVDAEDRLVAVDTQTTVPGLPDVPQVDMMNLDVERIIAMQPDLMLVTEITMFGQSDAIGQIENSGTEILVLPTETSFADIENSIELISTAVGAPEEGRVIVSDMQDQIAEVKRVAQTIQTPKSVLFEISPAPEIYSAGSGTFLDEMITTVGATNVLSGESGWVPVTEEAAIALNPDVILTNINFIDDPVAEIVGRPAWAHVNAVQHNQVFQIDNSASSVPNQNVITALHQIAHAVYPDEFPSAD